MAKNNILDLYEGLTKQEAQQFSDLIYPTLAAVRETIHNPTGEKTMFYNRTPDVPVSISEDTIAEVVRQALHNLSLTRDQSAQR